VGKERVRVAGKSGDGSSGEDDSTDFNSRPRTDGRVRKASTARRRRKGGDVHGAIPVRGPCDRMCGSASVRGSSTRVEMHQFCQPPPKSWLAGLERHEKSRGKNHCHVVRGSLLKARWRWWGRPRVGGGRRWDPYRNAGSAGTRLGLHEVALLRRDCRSSRGGIARATSIRRRHFARRARTGTALETRNSARGVTWTT
jgi:hypothetical protein